MLEQPGLAALQPIRFEGNILRNNQDDLVLQRGDDSKILNNSFEGAGPGYRPAGIVFSGDSVQAARNRFSDVDTAIVLWGDEPVFGTFNGIASNAVLTANGFCTVATNYVFELLSTYDLQSTLPPCTGPELDITRSVLLSWPYDIQGYSVETAPTMDGPWTPSDATPFLQDGHNNMVIPAESGQQFFRLHQQ